jgi:hypothetical protein
MRSTAWPDAQTWSSADARSTLAFRFETTVTWAPATTAMAAVVKPMPDVHRALRLVGREDLCHRLAFCCLLF